VCGIVAILRRPGGRALRDGAAVLDHLAAALAAAQSGDPTTGLTAAAEHIEQADAQLRGAPGVRLLLDDRGVAARAEALATAIGDALTAVERDLDAGGLVPAGSDLEALNAALLRAKDAAWAVGRDRMPTARAVADLAGTDLGWSAVEGYTSIQEALAALDRLEVRGRDSAGLTVLVRDHGLVLDDPGTAALLGARLDDPLLRSGAVRTDEGHLLFVYKAAAEIGELGDNTRALRAAIRADEALRLALDSDDARSLVLAHTRWASVGIVSEPNAHPLDSAEVGSGDDRSSPPRSTATSTTSPTSPRLPTSRSRRRSPPTRRSSRPSCRAAWQAVPTCSRRSARPSPRSRGASRSRPPPRGRRRRSPWRCGAAVKPSTSVSPMMRSSSRASPTASSS
jgi:glucosamine--fructose-6-phosphate aminotransferase (isomerizing)